MMEVTIEVHPEAEMTSTWIVVRTFRMMTTNNLSSDSKAETATGKETTVATIEKTIWMMDTISSSHLPTREKNSHSADL